MTNQDREEWAALLKELMNRYAEHRVKWIRKYHSAEGFDRWFTNQAIGHIRDITGEREAPK